MTLSLEELFTRFVPRLDGYESVDALLQNVAGLDIKRADYLFAGRKIVCEQKTLSTDPRRKAQKFVAKVANEDIGDDASRFAAYSILQQLPEGDEHVMHMLKLMSSVIPRCIADADEQIGATRQYFGLGADAPGILILLNQGAASLDPAFMSARTGNVLQGRNNSHRFPNVDLVITISDNAPNAAGGIAYPRQIRVIANSRSPNLASAEAFAVKMKRSWEEFRGTRYIGWPLVRRQPPGFYDHPSSQVSVG